MPSDAPPYRARKKPQYGSHPQLTLAHDDSSILAPPALTRIQKIIGTLLFNGCSVDIIMIVTLGTIASNQREGTQTITQAVTQLLNYASAQPDATVRYHASDMCLHIHSDASCLSETNARSRTGSTSLLSTNPIDHTKHPSTDNPPPPYNCPIHTSSAIMANFMASSTEAEFGALLHNVRLLPLPEPPLRACTDTRINPNAQRSTQLRSVLARVYAVARQNHITTTVP
jgi:hypothetical protein